MDDSTQPRPATDLTVGRKSIKATKHGFEAEYYVDGGQRVERMPRAGMYPLIVGGQTITEAQGNAILTAMFNKCAPSAA
jgi:hypothetical protein